MADVPKHVQIHFAALMSNFCEEMTAKLNAAIPRLMIMGRVALARIEFDEAMKAIEPLRPTEPPATERT
jgi:hypothetical protein